jgi:hypothetical protein
MNTGDELRAKAAELEAKARSQPDRLFRSMYERLSKSYLQMAVHADRIASDKRELN